MDEAIHELRGVTQHSTHQPLLKAAIAALSADASQAAGLPSALYTDPGLFALERQRIFYRHWLAVGHVADVPQAGDAVPVDACGVPLILVRDREGAVRGYHNVCGHRGLKLLDEPCRGRPTLVCPYHGWAYDLRGALRATPDFGGFGERSPPDFDMKAHGLRPVRLAEAFGGHVFADLSETAPPFVTWAKPLLDRWAPYRFEVLQHAHSERCIVEANWKLVAENFVDTLHLEWVHPQVAGYSRPEDHYDVILPPAYGSGSYNVLSSDTLAHVIPLFPDLPAELANRGEFLYLYPNLLIFLLPNQTFSITLEPLAPGRCGERLDFSFVPGGEPEAAADARRWWIDGWRHLNGQDFGMLRRLQQGRASPVFAGGCFSSVMDQVALALQRRVASDLQAGGS
jgi:choline monooxygenase